MFLKIAFMRKRELLICGFDFLVALSLGLSEYFSSTMNYLRTFARKFSNIDFSLILLPLKVVELLMSKM